MKAFRITSTEYHANTPSVFLFVDGEYFGDTVYAMRDKFPQNIEHWHHAMCADEGRFFKVEEIELPEFVLRWMREINEEINTFRRWMDISPEKDWTSFESKIYTYCQAQVKLIKIL